MVITAIDSAGAEVKQKRVRAREADVLRYFSVPPARTVRCGGDGKLVLVRGSMSVAPHRVDLAHARKLKAISSAKVKIDSVDSLTLAQLLREGHTRSGPQFFAAPA